MLSVKDLPKSGLNKERERERERERETPPSRAKKATQAAGTAIPTFIHGIVKSTSRNSLLLLAKTREIICLPEDPRGVLW